MKQHIETEVRFLEVNAEELKAKLLKLGASDLGENNLKEVIFYDKAGEWQREKVKFIRVRKDKNGTQMAFKQNLAATADGTKEIETSVGSFENTIAFLETVGFNPFREQEKRRHSFKIDGVTVDIDTWPKIPTYVELEGETEDDLKQLAKKLGLDWSTADMHGATWVIENTYNIPVRTLRYFTFSKFE